MDQEVRRRLGAGSKSTLLERMNGA